MNKCFSTDLYRAFHNKWFYASLLVGVALAVGSIISVAVFQLERIPVRLQQADISNPMVEARSAYATWMGGEGVSVFSSIFFYAFPLLAVLPYAWSYQYEKAIGYQNHIMMKHSRGTYLAAKFGVVFISGGFVVLAPQIINFLCTMAIFPLVRPDPSYLNYYGIFRETPFCDLFYEYPMLFIGYYLVLNFIFGGLFSCLALSFSIWGVTRVLALLLPMLLCIPLHVIPQLLANMVPSSLWVPELSPLYFLKQVSSRYFPSLTVILAEALIMAGTSLVTMVMQWRQKDVL